MKYLVYYLFTVYSNSITVHNVIVP